MANASKKHLGPGTQGKGDGSGAMTDLADQILGQNMVLSNRDKAQHGDERGLDSKFVQVEQQQDTVANQQGAPLDAPKDTENTTGVMGGERTIVSGDESSTKSR
ncbi:hypothetical protein ASG43_18470 [Aureimonas sp. Leaf454]|uniref:hypothetical protein n=1 Tax=Aureimonas sp. Leaf454 TaxID=1736381 RepID=UPI0006F2747E|nr:hypothetical protein [Aureimonas sp. Leaf454]KQT53211.1 hypothetical protein ASG43_18470 [Aureimonas sp. Leaf454]